MGKKGEKKRLRLTGGDRVVLVVMAILAGITVIINILRACGLALIRGELYALLPVGILVMALGWGGFLLVRMIRNKTVRMIVGIVAAVVLLVVLMILLSYLSLVISVTVPQRYATVSTTDGRHKLVVMRVLDMDDARIDARQAARLEADPDADPETLIEDYGYRYTAYAPAAGLFYRPDSLIEGEIYLGYASKAELMVDWEEEATIGHFFLKDPQPGDSGELRARTSGS